MKKTTLFIFLMLVLSVSTSCATSEEEAAKKQALEEARQDYKLFLKELKALNSQYKEITGEMQKIVREEGFPTWDQGTGQVGFAGPLSEPAESRFGDIDIKETDKDMIVKVDLPGVKKNEIKVQIENDKILKIEGERDHEKEEAKETSGTRVHRVERQHGRFERLVELPAPAKDSGTEAWYENGVLTVKIPKAAETKKEVSIKVK